MTLYDVPTIRVVLHSASLLLNSSVNIFLNNLLCFQRLVCKSVKQTAFHASTSVKILLFMLYLMISDVLKFCWEGLKVRGNSENVVVCGSLILKQMLEKYGGRVELESSDSFWG